MTHRIKILHLIQKIFSHPLFIAGCCIKLACALLFSSDYLLKFFIPFVDYFVDSGKNPYAHFYAAGKEAVFPYPAFMLYLLAIPGKLFPFLPKILCYRLTLFAADVTILLVLCSWAKTSFDKVLKLYWLCPVLIYISYIHGQLDVVPVAILMTSLYLLFHERFALSLLCLGLSIAAKTSMVLAYPLFFIYMIFQFSGERRKLAVLLLPIISFVTVNWTYLTDVSFLDMVFNNATQKKLLSLTVSFGTEGIIYIVPVVYLFILGQAFLLRLKTKEMFILFSGFAFGVITAFIEPMQGWYYWPLPFWIYFYTQSAYRGKSLFFMLQACYFLYFLVIPQSDYFKVLQPILPMLADHATFYDVLIAKGINAPNFVNLCFSLLQGVLILNLYWLYERGVDTVSQHKLLSRPLLIGIGGDSGAGKTTLSGYLFRIFGERNITLLKGDDRHRWERGDQHWENYTHLDPRANHLHQEYADLYDLKYEQSVMRRTYDHKTGKFTQEKPVAAKRVIVYEGLHPFFLKKMRDLFDVRIFVSPDPELTMHWKIVRDQKERGHSKERIVSQIEKRKNDYQKYVATQEKYADLQVKIHLNQPIRNIGDPGEDIRTHLELICTNIIPLEPLIDTLSALPGINVEHAYNESDTQSIRIHGTPSPSAMHMLIETLSLEQIASKRSQWLDGQDGLIELLIAYAIMKYIHVANNR